MSASVTVSRTVGPESAQRDPHPPQRLGMPRVGHVLRGLAAHAGELAVDGPDNVGQGDLGRGPGEPEAAVGTALAAQDAWPTAGSAGQPEPGSRPTYLVTFRLIG
jgi:hypothetical protein